MRAIALAVMGCMACGCGPSSLGGGGDGDSSGDGAIDARPDLGFIDARQGGDEFADGGATEECSKMDILFVVDNSYSMAEEQTNLADNFPMFIDVLNAFRTTDGTEIDYRVAVTSTARDMEWQEVVFPGFPTVGDSQSGDNGAMLQRCGMTRRWLEKSDPDVGTTFACAAELGIDGPALEMPLYMTKLALGDRVADGTNAGFLRDDALLAVVILTDEDDCSREDNNFTLQFDEKPCDNISPVQPYVGFLDGVAGGAGRWAAAVIAGPGPGTCSSAFGDAVEADRLKDFVGQIGDGNGVFSSICEGDLASGLSEALETFELACQNLPPVD